MRGQVEMFVFVLCLLLVCIFPEGLLVIIVMILIDIYYLLKDKL